MLFALKAIRDKVNTTTDLPGQLRIVAAGPHKSLLTDMATRRSQAFAGAHTASFEPLGKDHVEWFLNRVAAAGLAALAFSRITAGHGRGLYIVETLPSFSNLLGRENPAV